MACVGRIEKFMSGDWRTLWRITREHIRLEAGAIAFHPGDPVRVVVTEEWAFNGALKCDNTNYRRLSDGREAGGWIMYKYPFMTPRIEVVEVGAGFAAVSTPHTESRSIPAAARCRIDWAITTGTRWTSSPDGSTAGLPSPPRGMSHWMIEGSTSRRTTW
jgi:hypothetical protein